MKADKIVLLGGGRGQSRDTDRSDSPGYQDPMANGGGGAAAVTDDDIPF